MTDTEIATRSGFCDNIRDILQRARDNAYRQINEHYYESLVKDKAEQNTKSMPLTPKDIIKAPYVLEFLELKDNPTIGIILCTDKDHTVVKYSSIDNEKLFVSKYQLYLPTEEELRLL